jgi:hypothetical protein
LTRPLELGETYELDIAFLDRETALSHLHAGVQIQLWEGKVIADGVVVCVG